MVSVAVPLHTLMLEVMLTAHSLRAIRLGVPGRGTACAGSVRGGFQHPLGESSEQPGLMLELALLGAGGWTGDLTVGPSHLRYPVML